jgi:hypothetical protein
LSASFSTGAAHKLADGAVIQEITALHVSVGHFSLTGRPSVSTQIAALRNLLLALPDDVTAEAQKSFRDVARVRLYLT